MTASLFLSYSHKDSELMLRITRHLEGMLLNKVKIWSDKLIAPGALWETTLQGSITHASTGLVLVSPEYLVSSWCRRELQALYDAVVKKELIAVYWLLLKPCGWKHCEQLSCFQAVQEPADKAVLDESKGSVCEEVLLNCCDKIAGQLTSIVRDENPNFEQLRSVLRQTSFNVRLVPSFNVRSGDFSLSSRALWPSGNDVYVKVLMNAPLTKMRELFFKVSKARRDAGLRSASLMRIHGVEQVGTGHEERIVMLSDMARGMEANEEPDSLKKVIEDDAKLGAQNRHLTQDVVKLILLRIAEALAELHEVRLNLDKNAGSSYTHIMGPLAPAHIFYNRSTQRPQLSLASVSSFLWQFFETETFGRLINPEMGGYRLPEREQCTPETSGKTASPQTSENTRLSSITQKADQYFLGMLALELLEGRILFGSIDSIDSIDSTGSRTHLTASNYANNTFNPAWREKNSALAEVIQKLLQPNPGDRFNDMRQAAMHLRNLEDQKYALAKFSYRQYMTPEKSKGLEFSTKFYERFFSKSDDAKKAFELAWKQNRKNEPDSKTADPKTNQDTETPSTLPPPDQHRKLIAALAAVLNYRGGSQPTSISPIAERHRELNIEKPLFDHFRDSFLEVLRKEIRDKNPRNGETEAIEISAAWEELFAPVIDDMKSNIAAPAAHEESAKPALDGNKQENGFCLAASMPDPASGA